MVKAFENTIGRNYLSAVYHTFIQTLKTTRSESMVSCSELEMGSFAVGIIGRANFIRASGVWFEFPGWWHQVLGKRYSEVEKALYERRKSKHEILR